MSVLGGRRLWLDGCRNPTHSQICRSVQALSAVVKNSGGEES